MKVIVPYWPPIHVFTYFLGVFSHIFANKKVQWLTEDFIPLQIIAHSKIKSIFNYPTLDAGICRSVKRITINHYNVSGMISKFANILSSSNINIARMYNNSLDTVAYTILDLDSDISCETLTKLKQIDGVLRVRVLKGAK